jgi:predicted Zn-dependent protease
MSRHVKEQFVTLFAHEMGHAFGLAHSPSGLDIMYWKANARKLSQRDEETIRVLYRGKVR